MWSSFGDPFLKPSEVLLCDQPPNNVTMKPHIGSPATDIRESLLWKHDECVFFKIHQITSFWCQLMTHLKTTVTVTLQSPDDYSSESNSRSDFSVNWPIDDHLRVIMSRMKNVAFSLYWRNKMVTLVTLCNIKETSHQLVVLLESSYNIYRNYVFGN